MQVRMADSAMGYLDDDLAALRLWCLDLKALKWLPVLHDSPKSHSVILPIHPALGGY
jgi:hypothetical protein